jgi:CheY-like chemotaxis protein
MTAHRSYRTYPPIPERILCVSGDDQTAQELVRLLRKLRFRADAVSGIAEAQNAIGRRAPSLFVVDFFLQDGSGLELIRELRANRRTAKVPVLMLATPFQAEHYRNHPTGPGPQDWLHKPIDENRLTASVVKWVGVEIKEDVFQEEVESDHPRELAESGAFSDLPFARVLVLAGRRGAGRLCVQRGEQWLRIWVSGEVIEGLASSYISDSSLGQLLVQQGRISRYTLAEAQAAIAAGTRLGEWLCQGGFLSSDELNEQLQRQMLEKLTALFSWRWYDAEWRYERLAEFTGAHVRSHIPVKKITFDGIARYYDRDRLEMIFSKRERLRRPIIPTRPFYDDLPVAARRLLNAADGLSSPVQVRARAGMELLRFYQTLYSLWVLDLVRFGEPRKLGVDAAGQDAFLKSQDSLEFGRRH